METGVDVIIVGGGPTGLSLANDLSRWGVSFRVFDKKPEPERHSKAANLWPRTQEALAAIGVLDRLRAEASVVRTTTVLAFGKHMGHRPQGPYPSPHKRVLTINQGRIEQLLSGRLAEMGRPVEYGVEVTAVRQHEDYVQATVERGGERGSRRDEGRETVRGRYLIACDGGKGAVRDEVGLRVEPVALPGRALQQIDARLRWGRSTEPDRLWFFLFDDGFCGIVPLPGGLHRVFVLRNERHVPRRDPTLAEMQGALREITGDPLVELSDPVWFSHGRFRYGVAPALRQERVLLAGDAGHLTIPIGGQGMNTGIQDAFNLGWKLTHVLKGRAAPIVLDSYSTERQRVRRELAEDQAKNFYRLANPGAVRKLATRLLGPLIMRRQRSVELGRRDESQLGIGYPDSPLNEDRLGGMLLGRGGIRAGDRAPDAVVTEASSLRSTTLFDLIYDGYWTLLAFDHAGGTTVGERLLAATRAFDAAFPAIRPCLVLAGSGAPDRTRASSIPVLLDLDRFAHEAYGIKRPSLYLVRPDGHVAYRGRPEDADHLRTYLERLGVEKKTEAPPSITRRLQNSGLGSSR